MQDVHVFGIRHHGPGCARSLLRALEELAPDVVLIEGPAGAEGLLEHVADPGLVPPVALLSVAADDPEQALFHPYAVFSPEWQATQWAMRAQVPVRFMDLPAAVVLGLRQASIQAHHTTDEPPAETATAGEVALDPTGSIAEATDTATPTAGATADPLDTLARAAGAEDGEAWWNELIEERGDGCDLFTAIAKLMEEARATSPAASGEAALEEARREAHMRKTIRAARKDGFQRIAVICGAWHVPALTQTVAASTDQKLLKGLPKRKTNTTWVPWTYRHLAGTSGYAAGIDSPGWYQHVWQAPGGTSRGVTWFTRVARLLREDGLDCSSAHLIEATRLADTLAAMQGRAPPGLAHINAACRAVICHGEEAPMQLIAERLLIGDTMGGVPETVPVLPLKRDLTALQKRLRLKVQTLDQTLDLDLRKPLQRERSELLHRLNLLGIDWGEVLADNHRQQGTFHERWMLAWQPGFEVDLIAASRFGQTVERAATNAVADKARRTTSLAELAALIDKVLLARLADAVNRVADIFARHAAAASDPFSLLEALPALANVQRYGNVRHTDAAQVRQLFDSILARAAVGLPQALSGLADEAAARTRQVLLDADHAVSLREAHTQTEQWQQALARAMRGVDTAALPRGLVTRLLLDRHAVSSDAVEHELANQLSAGADALSAAHWLDGFLNRNAVVLLHGEVIWRLVDDWLCALPADHFQQVLPLIRRSFAEFEAADRRDLGARVQRDTTTPASPSRATTMSWDTARAERALPTLRVILGANHEAR